jgi:hypothetical protein
MRAFSVLAVALRTVTLFAGAGIPFALGTFLLASIIAGAVLRQGPSGLKGEQIREHQSIKPGLIEFLHMKFSSPKSLRRGTLLCDRVTKFCFNP